MNPGVIVGLLFAILGVITTAETFTYVPPAWVPDWIVIVPIWIAAFGAALTGFASSKMARRVDWLPVFQLMGGGLVIMSIIMVVLTPIAVSVGFTSETMDWRTPFVLPTLSIAIGIIFMVAAEAIILKRLWWMRNYRGQNVVNGRPW